MDCSSWEKEEEEEEETKYLERLFNKFDENGDGLMSKHEMGLFLSALRVHMTDQQTHALLNTADNDGDGCLDFKEFVIMYHVLCHNYLLPSSEQHLREAFVLFDENGDGFISADELGKVLISLGFAEGGCKLSCEKMIRSVDENGDGKVDFPEFKKMVLQGPPWFGLCTAQGHRPWVTGNLFLNVTVTVSPGKHQEPTIQGSDFGISRI